MVVHCCVLGCKNYNDAKSKKNNISFHKVPKLEPKRSKWLKAIGKCIFVTTLHFHTDICYTYLIFICNFSSLKQ